MYCEKCKADVGAGGVGQEDGKVLCAACDREVNAISFNGPSIETNLSQPDAREIKAALSALRAYGQKKSPSLRARQHAERAARVGSDSRAIGAGMAILGAADDDLYLMSAGLHINQAGHIRSVHAAAQVAARGPQRVAPMDPALIRLLAERGGDLARQPIRSKVAATRWLDTVKSTRLDSDGTVHGALEFVQMNARRCFDLTFDPVVGMWTVDLENEGRASSR